MAGFRHQEKVVIVITGRGSYLFKEGEALVIYLQAELAQAALLAQFGAQSDPWNRISNWFPFGPLASIAAGFLGCSPLPFEKGIRVDRTTAELIQLLGSYKANRAILAILGYLRKHSSEPSKHSSTYSKQAVCRKAR